MLQLSCTNEGLHYHRWVKLSGMDLIPGDVVSIGRPTGVGSEERTVPADMLLIAGSAIANEALLTGESTPQWKVSSGACSCRTNSMCLEISPTCYVGEIMLLQSRRMILY